MGGPPPQREVEVERKEVARVNTSDLGEYVHLHRPSSF